MTCSAKTPPVWFISQEPGVAETQTGLRAHRVPLLKAQRAVVDAGGQAEAIFGQRRLAVEVAPEHAADLRDGDVAFIDEDAGHCRAGIRTAWAAARRVCGR